MEELTSVFAVVVGPLVYVMDMTDRIISKLCPFIAGGIFIGSVYWTAVTYGAVTVMQVIIGCLFRSKSKVRLYYSAL